MMLAKLIGNEKVFIKKMTPRFAIKRGVSSAKTCRNLFVRIYDIKKIISIAVVIACANARVTESPASAFMIGAPENL